MDSNGRRTEFHARIVALLGRLAESDRFPNQAAMAQAAGLEQSSLSRRLAGRLRTYADELAAMLDAVGVDMVNVLLYALQHPPDRLDEVPTPVSQFLRDPRSAKALSDEQRQAFYWLGRAGWFDESTTQDELLELWVQLEARARGKGLGGAGGSGRKS